MNPELRKDKEYVLAKMWQLVENAEEYGLNCTVLTGEVAQKMELYVVVDLFNNPENRTHETEFYTSSVGGRLNDLRYYRARLLKINPYQKFRTLTSSPRNIGFARDVEDFLQVNDLPIMLVLFGKDTETKQETVEFYYPKGLVPNDAVRGLQILLQQDTAREN